MMMMIFNICKCLKIKKVYSVLEKYQVLILNKNMTIWCHNLEDNLNLHHHENLKSCKISWVATSLAF